MKPALKTKAIVEEQLMAALSAQVSGNPTGAPVSLSDGGNGDGSDAAAKEIWY